ncbi:MAG: rane fusion protein peptide pheromone/bacteriocin exporter [Petroclostridium sp.]|jgi:HlyD family secretion protein|nr:rane fusion protein peptide pheromone/bacteriocin exporter [Petroclostridium sp.]
MKAVIQEFGELTDSRELLESRPHPFMAVFAYILVTIIMTALLWSYFSEMDIVVKASGIVRPNHKISTIKNKVFGKVENVYFEEGQQVNKGDILYTVEHQSLLLEKDILVKELIKTEQELKNLKKFKQSILDGKNHFNENTEDEKEYYNKYVKYETDITTEKQRAELELSQLRHDTQYNEKSYSVEIQKNKENLKNLELLKYSIEEGKNLFNESNREYYNKYLDYMLNVQQMTQVIVQKQETAQNAARLFEAGAIAKKEAEDAQEQLESAELDLEKYKNEYMLNLHTAIQQHKRALEELERNLEKTEKFNEIYDGKDQYTKTVLEKYKMDKLVQLDADIDLYEKKLEQLKKDLEIVNLNILDCTVRAPIEGIVNIVTEISKGDLLQSGTEIATIVPEHNSKYKVQLYVSNKDIAGIRENQRIKYHFLALPYKEYGELNGSITRIGTDARTDGNNGHSFYLVEGDIENKPLYSYKGEKAEIKVGMACEAQVITKTKKVLYYLLEKINLKE